MLEYSVVRNDELGAFEIRGDFLSGSTPINIPDTNPKKKRYMALFLHKKDVENGLDFLHCISEVQNFKIVQGLFVAALTYLFKCFQATDVRPMLNENTFFKYAPQSRDEFIRFKHWRNKHFIHDENPMTEVAAFLLLSPENCPNLFGGPPSVIWYDAPIDYQEESHKLEAVMQDVWRFILREIDNLGAKILDEYSEESRDSLMKFGIADIRLATLDDPATKR